VRSKCGCGFLEKVYENALAHELRKARLSVEQQKAIPVFYDGIVAGDYCADIVVNGIVLLELKAVKAFDDIHKAQCMNYLKATKLPVCLLLNFGSTRLCLKRLVGESHPS
jgi:GxxExxY protein